MLCELIPGQLRPEDREDRGGGARDEWYRGVNQAYGQGGQDGQNRGYPSYEQYHQ